MIDESSTSDSPTAPASPQVRANAIDGPENTEENATGGPTTSPNEEEGTLKEAAVQRLSGEVDAHKRTVSDQMKQVSGAVDAARNTLQDRDAPAWLETGLSKISSSLQDLAGRVENKSSGEMLDEVGRFARSSPAMFLAGCGLAGFAAARLFRAGSAEMEHQP